MWKKVRRKLVQVLRKEIYEIEKVEFAAVYKDSKGLNVIVVDRSSGCKYKSKHTESIHNLPFV